MVKSVYCTLHLYILDCSIQAAGDKNFIPPISSICSEFRLLSVWRVNNFLLAQHVLINAQRCVFMWGGGGVEDKSTDIKHTKTRRIRSVDISINMFYSFFSFDTIHVGAEILTRR